MIAHGIHTIEYIFLIKLVWGCQTTLGILFGRWGPPTWWNYELVVIVGGHWLIVHPTSQSWGPLGFQLAEVRLSINNLLPRVCCSKSKLIMAWDDDPPGCVKIGKAAVTRTLCLIIWPCRPSNQITRRQAWCLVCVCFSPMGSSNINVPCWV